jgi:hypothetical protein
MSKKFRIGDKVKVVGMSPVRSKRNRTSRVTGPIDETEFEFPAFWLTAGVCKL